MKIHVWIKSFEEITTVNKCKCNTVVANSMTMGVTSIYYITTKRYISNIKSQYMNKYFILNQYFIISRKMEMRDRSSAEMRELEIDLEVTGTEKAD